MKVITLCGSTKFKKQFEEVNAALTLQGYIVLSLGFFEHNDNIMITKEQKELFRKIHFQKIEMADEIYVIDVNGYIGESTMQEIQYAQEQKKVVNYYSDNKLYIDQGV